MRTAVAIGAVVLLVVTLSAGGAQQSSPQVLFEKALALEEVQGKFTEAIAVYEKVVAESSDKALAARAQLRIGLCYERTDPRKAAKAFQQVLNGYKNHAEVVQEAKERLSTLQGAQPATAVASQGAALRRVWADAVDQYFSGGLSPDGRQLSFTDWRNCALGIRDLEKGESRILATCAAAKGEYVYKSLFSPDGRQIAYALQTAEGTGKLHIELRVIDIDGSTTRAIPASATWSPFPLAWMPDGKRILAESRATGQGTTKIGLFSVADGSLQELASWEGLFLVQAAPSPDGRHIAYSLPHKEGRAGRDLARAGLAPRDVLLMAADGSGQAPLVEHPADDFLLGWDPEGRRVVFASDRTGSTAIWAAPVIDGKPAGPAELLVPDVGNIQPLGMTKSGGLFYGFAGGWSTDVFVVTLDPETGKIVEPPTKVLGQNVGRNTSPDWSADGRFLVCHSGRPRPGTMFQGVLLIRDVQSGETRTLAPNVFAMNAGVVRWSPDGGTILVMGFGEKSRYGALFAVDARTGAARVVASPDKGAVSHAEWAPDGGTFFAVRSDEVSDRIARVDLKTGRETEVFRTPAAKGVHALAVSPDGRRIAFTAVGAVNIVPAAGGETQVLVSGGVSPTWSRDGKYILFARQRDKATGITDLWRVPAAGGQAQKLDLAAPGMAQLRMHPDGRRLAYSGRAESARPEVWVLENFLTASKR